MKKSPCKETNGRVCPNCSSKMEKGRLQTAGYGVSKVYLEIEGLENNPLGHIPVCVWFCRNCGQMLLFADITDQDSHDRE